ncbi:MAG: hypothetical protein ACRC77_11445, partial [Bacteroidales bacterium]
PLRGWYWNVCWLIQPNGNDIVRINAYVWLVVYLMVLNRGRLPNAPTGLVLNRFVGWGNRHTTMLVMNRMVD